jgi:hypothetical protein
VSVALTPCTDVTILGEDGITDVKPGVRRRVAAPGPGA